MKSKMVESIKSGDPKLLVASATALALGVTGVIVQGERIRRRTR